jgi:hypothetical protein
LCVGHRTLNALIIPKIRNTRQNRRKKALMNLIFFKLIS